MSTMFTYRKKIIIALGLAQLLSTSARSTPSLYPRPCFLLASVTPRPKSNVSTKKKNTPITPDTDKCTCPTPELTPDMYAKWRESELGNRTETIERGLLLQLMGDVSGKSVLEVGCGDGSFAVELSKDVKRHRSDESGGVATVTAIDASEAMINCARSRASLEGADVKFGIGMAQELPFRDKEFDVVVAQCILCFVKDPLPVFREISRVLKPGGYLVIGELGKRSTWALERQFRAAFLGSSLWKRAVFRTPKELKELASKAGLVPDAVKGAIYYPPWSPAARILAPYDRHLGQVTTFGAAFLAMKASKIETGGRRQ